MMTQFEAQSHGRLMPAWNTRSASSWQHNCRRFAAPMWFSHIVHAHRFALLWGI